MKWIVAVLLLSGCEPSDGAGDGAACAACDDQGRPIDLGMAPPDMTPRLCGTESAACCLDQASIDKGEECVDGGLRCVAASWPPYPAYCVK